MKKTILSIIAAVCLISCKKSFLEIVPLGTQLTVTTADYDKLMNDPAFYFSSSGGGLGEAQLMGDDVNADASTFNGVNPLREKFFFWDADIYERSKVLPPMLRTELGQRYTLNKIINEVMDSKEGTLGDKTRIRAEALASRAWSNFQLTNYYCKPYVEATATSDPGFPLITEPDINTSEFSRGTLKESYDAIIKDFTEAIAGLPAVPSVKTRMSKPAAQGLLGKVYLFMGKPAEALPLLRAALSGSTANGWASLYDYNVTLSAGGAFLPISSRNGPRGPGNDFSDMKEAIVSKVYYCGSYNGNVTGNNGLLLSEKARDLYVSQDKRLLLYSDKSTFGDVLPNSSLRKYGVQYSRWGLQLPDLYLLSAECKARLNDLSGAKIDVEALRKNRIGTENNIDYWQVPATIAADQTALIKFIIDERVREFAMEGHRWNDMRRISVDQLFRGINFSHSMYNTNGPATYVLKQPERLVLKLPSYIVDSSPGMVNNP